MTSLNNELYKLPKERLFPSAERFFFDNRYPLLFLTLSAFVVYGYELFNFNLSIDEETAGVDSQQLFWISMGRWGMYTVNRLLTTFTTTPVLPLAFSLILCVTAIMLIFRLFDKRSSYEAYLFPLLILIYPSLPYNLMFSLNAPGIGAGMLSAAIGLRLFYTKGRRRQIASLPFFAFAIGVYQSFLLLIATTMLLKHIFELVNSFPKTNSTPQAFVRESLQELSIFLIYLLLASSLYYLINLIFLFIADRQLAYVTGFINIEMLLNQTGTVLNNLYHQLYSTYGGRGGIYIDRTLLVPITLVLSICIVLAATVRKSASVIVVTWLIGLIALSLLAPFGYHLLNNGVMPYRTFLALPFAVVLFWWMGYRLSRGLMIKRLYVFLGVVIAIQFATINNRHFGSSGIALAIDYNVASQLIQVIDKSIFQSGMPSCLEFSGFRGLNETQFLVKSETFGASFFEWGEGEPIRMLNFLRFAGLRHGLGLCDVEKRRSIMPFVQNMPAWPMSGSVQNVEGVLVVKLSGYSRSQLNTLCSKNPDICTSP